MLKTALFALPALSLRRLHSTVHSVRTVPSLDQGTYAVVSYRVTIQDPTTAFHAPLTIESYTDDYKTPPVVLLLIVTIYCLIHGADIAMLTSSGEGAL